VYKRWTHAHTPHPGTGTHTPRRCFWLLLVFYLWVLFFFLLFKILWFCVLFFVFWCLIGGEKVCGVVEFGLICECSWLLDLVCVYFFLVDGIDC